MDKEKLKKVTKLVTNPAQRILVETHFTDTGGLLGGRWGQAPRRIEWAVTKEQKEHLRRRGTKGGFKQKDLCLENPGHQPSVFASRHSDTADPGGVREERKWWWVAPTIWGQGWKSRKGGCGTPEG